MCVVDLWLVSLGDACSNDRMIDSRYSLVWRPKAWLFSRCDPSRDGFIATVSWLLEKNNIGVFMLAPAMTMQTN